MNNKNNYVLFIYFLFFFLSGKPNILEFEKKAKWEAWNKQKGLSQDEAKEKYIMKANDLIKHGEKNE